MRINKDGDAAGGRNFAPAFFFGFIFSLKDQLPAEMNIYKSSKINKI
jgi:hypothetical protein